MTLTHGVDCSFHAEQAIDYGMCAGSGSEAWGDMG